MELRDPRAPGPLTTTRSRDDSATLTDGKEASR